MRIQDLIYAMREIAVLNIKNADITGITCDSRKVKNGYLFAALKGEKNDGRAFIYDALKKGAIAVLSDRNERLPSTTIKLVSTEPRKAFAKLCARFYGEPAKKLLLIGITGTNGKTTIAYLLQNIMKLAGIPTGRLGTVNNDLGGENPENTNMTTPDPETLQRYLKTMLDNGMQAAVLEVSSHSLAQHRTEGLRFQSAVFTNLTQDHLDFHKTLEEYANTKARLFQQIELGGSVIINGDDRYAGLMMRSSWAPVKTYGLNFPHNYFAKNLKITSAGTQFEISFPGGYAKINSPLIGKFNVYNLLATFAVAHSLHIDTATIVKTMRFLKGAPGRMERITNASSPVQIVVDYAHTPDALQNVLATLREISKSNLTVVFGAGGDRDRTKRPKMAAAAEKFADKIIITSDNPRTENPSKIISDIAEGIKNKYKTQIIEDRKKAIETAIGQASEGETILIAGKGHENYQEINDTKYPFDDREIASMFYQHYFGSKKTRVFDARRQLIRKKFSA